MEKIKFNNSNTIYDGKITIVDNDIFKIEIEEMPSTEIILSGFKLINEHNNIIMSDYSSFNTIYKESKDKKIVYLSTGAVYIEPEPVESADSISVELTEEELAEIEKQNQISSINAQMSALESEIAGYDYIFIKRQEIDQITDEDLKAAQLSAYEENYPSETLQSIITTRISLREQIGVLQNQLSELASE